MEIIDKLNKHMITNNFINRINTSTFFHPSSEKISHLKKKENSENRMNKTIIEYNEISHSKEKTSVAYNETFCPKDKDSLFWCFYIIVNGISNYEMITHRNLIIEKKLKFEYIDKIRQNKDILKIYKFATLQHIENILANEQKIDVKTFMTLCVIENLNIFYIKNKIFYQLLMNDNETIYQIHHLDSDKFGFKISSLNDCQTYKDTLYQLDNIDKPIKSISAYKVQDLIDISNKLGIEIKDKETNKTYTKNKLYESILLYF